MFCAMRRALAVLLAPVARVAAARRARELRLVQQRAAAVLALVRPGPRVVAVVPAGVPLQQVLQEAQLVRAGLVPQELAAVQPALVLVAREIRMRGSPRSTASSARTARRSTSKRRARR